MRGKIIPNFPPTGKFSPFIFRRLPLEGRIYLMNLNSSCNQQKYESHLFVFWLFQLLEGTERYLGLVLASVLWQCQLQSNGCLKCSSSCIATRRYGPLRRPTSSSCGGLWPSAVGFFCPSGKKRAYYAVLALVW